MPFTFVRGLLRAGSFGLLLVVNSCAPELSPTVHRQAILGGSLDLTHDAVVAVRQQRETDSTCSGVVIAIDPVENLASVLTAAHCLRGYLPSSIVAGPDYASPLASRFVPVDAAVHPQFRSDDDESPYDLAVLRITGDLSRLRVLELAAEEALPKPGDSVVAVGYGLEALDSGLPSSARRSVELVVSRVEPAGVIVDQSGGQGICSGDSGGPLLGRDAEGRERVVAVHSRVIPAASDRPPCLGESVSWPVSASSEFVRGAIRSAPPSACTACRSGAQSEGGVCLELRRGCEGRAGCAAPLACMSRCSEIFCKQQCKQSAPPEEVAALEAIDACPCTACVDSCPVTDVCEASPPAPPNLDAGTADADATDAAPPAVTAPNPEGGCAIGHRRDASSVGAFVALLALCSRRRRA